MNNYLTIIFVVLSITIILCKCIYEFKNIYYKNHLNITKIYNSKLLETIDYNKKESII